MGIIDMSAVSTDELNEGLEVGEDIATEDEEIVTEETDNEASDSDDDEFADLFGDDDEDPEEDVTEGDEPAAETAAVVEPAKDKPVAQELKPAEGTFTPDMTPGTKEYLERIASESEAIVKKLFGVEEYDPFDSKHIAAFNRVSRKLDEQAEKLYDDKSQEIKQQAEVAAALDTAEQSIGQIFNGSKEIAAKFEAAIDMLPVSKFREMQAKAQKGDYTSFINLAKRVAGLKAKVDQVNGREQPAPRAAKARSEDEPVQRKVGGVADFLGI